MRRTPVVLVLALLVAAGACSSARAERRVTAPAKALAGVPATDPAVAQPSFPSSTTTSEPPTTEAPTTTTSALPAVLPKVVTSPSGVVLPVLGRDPGGLLVATPCSGRAVVSRFTAVGPVDVVLDPGHGGHEKGAVGPNGLTEKALNFGVARAAQDALAKAGVASVLDRTADYDVTLEDRAAVAMALRPRAFVSIHHNAEPDGPRDGPGTETYYQVASAESKRLAGLIYEEVVKALAPYQVPWMADTDAGAKYRKGSSGDDYYGVLRRTHGVPGVLAELGFITNPPEADLYARPDVQQVEGQAVARGIVRWLRTKDPGSGFVEPYPRTTPAGGGGGAEGCVDPALG